MFEHKSKTPLSKRDYLRRQLSYAGYSLLIIMGSLGIGMAGYMLTEGLGVVDALLNASMILTGMGPVDKMTNNGSKIFASLYSLYSGVAFLTTTALLLAPALHRLLHLLHVEVEE